MSYLEHPTDLMLERNSEKRNQAIDQMTEQEVKEFLKMLLSVMNGGGRTTID